MTGLLVLGRRSSGDVYSDQDVDIIATVADQGAVAYANVQLVERLRGLTRQLVRTDEKHRKQVARDLHDTVLQQLFFVKTGLIRGRDQDPVALVAVLDEGIETLNRTIKAQRPPLLDYGLRLALLGLVEEMQKLGGSPPVLSWRCNVIDRLDLSDEGATALYRIAQEAVTNAFRHAHAQNITVTLEAGLAGTITLSVEDDGDGMASSTKGTGRGEHEFGLAGMQERATMIDGELHITSVPGEGTIVTVEVLL